MIRKRNEFHYHKTYVKNKNGNLINKPHPSYVWLEDNDYYHYHTITHSKRVLGLRLKQFKVNPNPKDKRKSFYDIDSQIDLMSNFGKRKKDWKISSFDKNEIAKTHKKAK